MVNNQQLATYCDRYLSINKFRDYCPNGLQIEGRQSVQKLVAGVSANLALIEQAIDEKADALLVHHGFFWKNEPLTITGIKKNRIKALLAGGVNLLAYHLPLDAHPIVGNNAQLAQRLAIKNPVPIGDTLVWQGELDASLAQFSNVVAAKLARTPQVFGDKNRRLRKIAWCTGGAQTYFQHAISAGVDCFLTGEISEPIPAQALENNIAFIAAGHHATERYGADAFGRHLAEQFTLDYQFIEVDNPV